MQIRPHEIDSVKFSGFEKLLLHKFVLHAFLLVDGFELEAFVVCAQRLMSSELKGWSMRHLLSRTEEYVCFILCSFKTFQWCHIFQFDAEFFRRDVFRFILISEEVSVDSSLQRFLMIIETYNIQGLDLAACNLQSNILVLKSSRVSHVCILILDRFARSVVLFRLWFIVDLSASSTTWSRPSSAIGGGVKDITCILSGSSSDTPLFLVGLASFLATCN